jgi:hypothetical protein
MLNKLMVSVTRIDSGQSQFNYSEIAGNAIGAGIASSCHPAQDRTFSNTVSIWGTQIMWDGVANEMKEFWPTFTTGFVGTRRSSSCARGFP